MFRNKSADTHQFSMIPKTDIPRSSFRIQTSHKTTFDSGFLVPIYIDEVLPGDQFTVRMTAFARLATPLFPIMDNLHLDTFFFFVPNRLVWANWEKFMGEQANPADSIAYVIPQIVSTAGGYTVGNLYDHMGLPTVGQVTAGMTVTHSALPLRAYHLIYNEWFRDENLQNSAYSPTTDGPDTVGNYTMKRRNKRHDYFTACLPWPQKGNPVTLSLGTSAPVLTDGTAPSIGSATAGFRNFSMTNASAVPTYSAAANATIAAGTWSNSGLFADLSTATSATINQLRQSIAIQRLLEKDARGGTRYTETVRQHFGVVSPDARLQRPEYLGGGSSPISVNPIAQTSASGITGGTTPAGTLAAMATGIAMNNGFSQAFTEHGHIIGIAAVRADLNYQQGLRKMWSRSTRYDFYVPTFANLGEQAVLNKEIYVVGGAAGGQDDQVFGYQERWAEMRYHPSLITGLFKSTSAGTIDPWHLAQKFTALPTLNTTFIEDTPPLSRVLAVGASANGQQIIMDAFFDNQVTRPLPMYSVPGMGVHF